MLWKAFTRRRIFLALAAFIMSPLPAGAQSSTLRVVQITDLNAIDPLFTNSPGMRTHALAVFETLFALDSKLRPQPMMVENSNVSADQLTWRFRLRRGPRFHDGQVVTTADVIPSLRRWMARDSFGRKFAKVVESMEAIDERTFSIRLSEPFAYVEAALGSAAGMLPVIMRAKDAMTPSNEQVKEAVGSGPFRFVASEWVSGSRRVYARNDTYAARDEPPDGLAGGHRVGVDRMEWRIIPDFSTAAAAVQTGEMDFWDIVPADVLPTLRANKAVVVDVVQPYGSWGALSPNFLFPPFNDVRARQALALMVDQRDYMNTAVGTEMPWRTCYSYLGCGLPYSTEVGSEPFRKQDLARARQLMLDAGYKGETLVLLSASGNQFMTSFSHVAASELKSIGVNVDLQLPDTAIWASRTANKSEPGPQSAGWNLSVSFANGVTNYQPLTNIYIETPCDGKNIGGWACDAEAERLREALVRATGDGARKTALEAWHRRLWEVIPMVLLGHFQVATVWRASLSGVLKSPVTVFWNIHKE